MPKSNKCASKSNKFMEALDYVNKYQESVSITRICGLIKLTVTLKDQVNIDYINNAINPSPSTVLAATQLIKALNSEAYIALLDNSSPISDTTARFAFAFGLNVFINCQVAKLFTKTCTITDNSINVAGLGWLANSASIYSNTNGSALKFVCCLLDILNKIKDFLDDYFIPTEKVKKSA